MILSVRRLGTFFALSVLAFSGSHAFAASAPSLHISNNWAGYAVTDDSYTSVSASWTVPNSTRTDRIISADAAWVGIGGITDDDLIQAGTQAIIRNGQTTYTAWYELLPDTQQTIPLKVNAGDQVFASVNEISANLWRITITNLTTNQTYTNTFTYESSHSSAEWIIERPLAIAGNATGYLPLSNFGDVTFTNASVTSDKGTFSIDDINPQPLIMSSTGTRLLASPKGVEDGSFAVSYLSSSQSSQLMRQLKRTYNLQRETNVSSRTPHYQQINTNYIIRVIF